MVNEYWRIKRKDNGWYLISQSRGWTPDVNEAMRYSSAIRADIDASDIRHMGYKIKLIHVRVRSPSERIWLTEKVKAWEPIMRAALAWGRACNNPQCDIEVCMLLKALPPEHKP